MTKLCHLIKQIISFICSKKTHTHKYKMLQIFTVYFVSTKIQTNNEWKGQFVIQILVFIHILMTVWKYSIEEVIKPCFRLTGYKFVYVYRGFLEVFFFLMSVPVMKGVTDNCKIITMSLQYTVTITWFQICYSWNYVHLMCRIYLKKGSMVNIQVITRIMIHQMLVFFLQFLLVH